MNARIPGRWPYSSTPAAYIRVAATATTTIGHEQDRDRQRDLPRLDAADHEPRQHHERAERRDERSDRSRASPPAAERERSRSQVAGHRDEAERQRQRLEVVGPAHERAHRGVDQREQREARAGRTRRSRASSAGVRPTIGAPVAQPDPRIASAIRSWNASDERAPGRRSRRTASARPPPIPTTLPVSSWRGDAALIISSMTRLLFSAATPVATHIP